VEGAEPVSMESCAEGVQVQLKIVINEHGKVAESHLDYASDPKLGAAAIDAVRRWRYEPAQKDGKAVPCFLSLRFRVQTPGAGTQITSSEKSATPTLPEPNELKPAPLVAPEDLPRVASTPEKAVRAMLTAYDERDWPAYFSMLDPKVIRKFRDEFLAVARQEEQRDGVSHLLKENGEGAVAALERKSPAEAVGRLVESYIRVTPAIQEIANAMRTEILGSVEEDPDTVNVSMRTTSSLVDAVAQVWVQPVRRTEAGWVLMRSNDPRDLLGYLRNESSRARLICEGVLARPAESSFDRLERHAYSCDSDPPVKISGSQVNFLSDRKRKPGKARVLTIVDENGHVAATRVEATSGPAFEKTSGPALEDALVNAIKSWRFKPGRRNGEPASCFFTVSVNFSVN
jgi:TonB family protein